MTTFDNSGGSDLYIRKNGSTLLIEQYDGTAHSKHLSTVLQLAAGDYVEAALLVDSGTHSIGHASNRQDQTCVQIVRLDSQGRSANDLTSTTLGGDVTLTNINQWYDVLTLDLNSGTYLVCGNAQLVSTGGANHQYQLRLYDGAAVVAEGQAFDAAGNWQSVALSVPMVLASSATIKLQACDTVSGGVVKTTLSANGSTKATVLSALRIT